MIYEKDIVKAVCESFKGRTDEYLTDESFDKHMDDLQRDVLQLLGDLGPAYVMNFLITVERNSDPRRKYFIDRVESLIVNKEDFARDVIGKYGRYNHIFTYGPRLFMDFAPELAVTMSGYADFEDKSLRLLVGQMNGDGDRLFTVLMVIEERLAQYEENVVEPELFNLDHYLKTLLNDDDRKKFISNLEKILDTSEDPLVLREAYSIYTGIWSSDITEHDRNMWLTRICSEAVRGIDDIYTRCWLAKGLVTFHRDPLIHKKSFKECFINCLFGLISDGIKEDVIIRLINNDNSKWQDVPNDPHYRQLMLDLTEIIFHPDRYAKKKHNLPPGGGGFKLKFFGRPTYATDGPAVRLLSRLFAFYTSILGLRAVSNEGPPAKPKNAIAAVNLEMLQNFVARLKTLHIAKAQAGENVALKYTVDVVVNTSSGSFENIGLSRTEAGLSRPPMQ